MTVFYIRQHFLGSCSILLVMYVLYVCMYGWEDCVILFLALTGLRLRITLTYEKSHTKKLTDVNNNSNNNNDNNTLYLMAPFK